MKKGYHRYFIFLIFVLILGCVGCGKKESVEEEGYVIQMEEWAAENIYVSLDKDFRENKSGLRMEADLDLYSLEPEMEEAHAQIARKYLWLAEEQAAQYKEYPSEEDPLYENQSYGVGTITCTFSRCYLGLMNDLELWEKLAGYFEDRLHPDTIFFPDTDQWFGKSDLAFMSADEALDLCKKFLEEVGAEYKDTVIEWYTLDEAALEKKYDDMRNKGTAPASEQRCECYVISFKNKLEGYEISTWGRGLSNQEATFVVTEKGFLTIFVDCTYKNIKKEENALVPPMEILEKVISTVSSVLTRQTYTIYDMKLMIQATETDYSTGRTVFTPVWVLKVKISDSEGQTESYESFVYDAISGLALERW